MRPAYLSFNKYKIPFFYYMKTSLLAWDETRKMLKKMEDIVDNGNRFYLKHSFFPFIR